MIKGVNHQIIEVRQTDNPYFERALLFVNGAYAEQPQSELDKQARAYLRETDAYHGLKEAYAMRWFKRCALVVLGAFLGMLGGVLLAQFR